jgi:ribosomal protein S18 acetylase RimI-like enzyme
MIKIIHYENINFTPAIIPLAEAWASCMKSGDTEPAILLSDKTEAILALAEDELSIIGALAWVMDSPRREAYLLLAWVSPDSRHKGILDAMYDALADRAKTRGLHHIMYDTKNPGTSVVKKATFLVREDILG